MKLVETGLTPIPGPSPAGRDSRYDPLYEQLQAEIDKLTSVTHSGEVDWQRVVDLASEIIGTRSKDLLAAAYMSVGLMHRQGFAGLAVGTRILNDMVSTFWEDCFPPKKRVRGRANAFSWWQEKTLAWLKSRTPEDSPSAEACALTAENVGNLDRALGELLPDFQPMREMLAVLDRVVTSLEPSDDTSGERPDAGGPESPPPSTALRPEMGSAAESPLPEDAEAARKNLASAALAFAGTGLSENSSDPWAWKASRIAAWIQVRDLPPSEGGQTMIAAPDTSIKKALEKLLSNGRLLEAALKAEEHFTGAVFWLDLQRLISAALEGLGGEYQQALEVVRSEMSLLLRRLEGLDQLSFSDGTPFADTETRAWIASLERRGAGADPVGDTEDPVEDVLNLAVERFGRKDVSGAMDLISGALKDAGSGLSRLRLRMGQIDLLCRAGRFGMASALADEVLTEIDRRGLETWDPPLSVRAMLACHEAYAGLGGEADLDNARKLAARVTRVRPSAALSLAI